MNERALLGSPDSRMALGLLAGATVLVLATWKAGVLVALGLVGAVTLAVALALRPSLATALGVVLLFTNLPVVLAQREILPTAAAAVVPLLFVPALGRHVVVLGEGFRVDRTFLLMLLFLGVLVLSAFRAAGPDVALERIGVFASEGLLVYLLVFNAVRSPRELRTAILAALASAALLSAFTLYQGVTGDYDQQFMGLAGRGEPLPGETTMGEIRLEDRSRGPVDDPNRYAQILLMALPLGAVLLLNGRGLLPRVAPLLGSGLIVSAVLLTYSRGAFLTMVVLAIIAGALRMVPRVPFFALMAAGAFLVPVVVPGYAERVRSIMGAVGLVSEEVTVEADGATRGRTTEMLAAFLAWSDHPLLGVGPGQYAPYHSVSYMSHQAVSYRAIVVPRRAHNLFLEMAAETGILGLVVFMAIPALLLRDLWRLRQTFRPARPELARWAEGFALVVLGYLGNGMFLHLSFERYYWFFIALTACAVAVLVRVGAQVGVPRAAAGREPRPRTRWSSSPLPIAR